MTQEQTLEYRICLVSQILPIIIALLHTAGIIECLSLQVVYKLTRNYYDPDVKFTLSVGVSTRGNKYKLDNCTFHYNIKKYLFCPRIINIWNSLPNTVVDVDIVNLVKSRLDKFWMHQKVKYDYTTELAGTINRSEYYY